GCDVRPGCQKADQRKNDAYAAQAKPQCLVDSHLAFSSSTTYRSSSAISSSLTCTSSLSLSTSTSSTSSSRDGHLPWRRQRAQQAISANPCKSRNAPAIGMNALNG